ncbi:MAG: dapD [Parcubacteria group bacterium]|nr:dapD [Parcubacteria group bacterium]
MNAKTHPGLLFISTTLERGNSMTNNGTRAYFDALVAKVHSYDGYRDPYGFGIGICHVDEGENFLDGYFALPNYMENLATAAVIAEHTGYRRGNATYVLTLQQMFMIREEFRCFDGDGKPHPNIDVMDSIKRVPKDSHDRRKLVATFIGHPEDDDETPWSVPEIYLRLHLLSHRKVLPNEIGVTPGKIMGQLPNVAWTSEGPIATNEVNGRILAARVAGNALRVYGVDRLPHMCDYVVPEGVRIADSARVRLGAYVGVGTTMMPSGFINFNAGTRGRAMIEGRVSQGVIVGDGSDLGGGASTQGTMSGGSNVQVSIGERTLIGALAGTGISLGDDCIVAAGVYIMPSNEITVRDQNGAVIRQAKVYEFSGQSGLKFNRGEHGELQVCPNDKAVVLNPLLHSN